MTSSIWLCLLFACHAVCTSTIDIARDVKGLDSGKMRGFVTRLGRANLQARNALTAGLRLPAASDDKEVAAELQKRQTGGLVEILDVLSQAHREAVEAAATTAILEYHAPSQQKALSKGLAVLGWLALSGAILGTSVGAGLNHAGMPIAGFRGGAIRAPIAAASDAISSTLGIGRNALRTANNLVGSGMRTSSTVQSLVGRGFHNAVQAGQEAKEALDKAFQFY